MQTILGIIPARGGSKGVPKKNIHSLGGKPLIAYTIEAAIKSKCFDYAYVSTDDPEIKEISRKLGMDVINRPPKISGDNTPSQDVMRHALIMNFNGQNPDIIVLLQPTSPFRNELHIEESIGKFLQSDCNSCISVTRASHHPYKSFTIIDSCLHPLFKPETLHAPRQNLPEAFQQNGAIYIVKTDLFLKSDTFAINPILPYIMKQEESIDIDTIYDFKIAELLLREHL